MKIERIFRPRRLMRGNTSITVQMPADRASWIWHPALVDEIPGLRPRVVRFRNEFYSSGAPFVFDVSADERFVLLVDGEVVARGPNRGMVENWQCQTYRAALSPGRHVVEAVCWTLGTRFAPKAQLSWKGGFVFSAEGDCAAALTTAPGSPWKVGLVEGTTAVPATPGSGAWGTGGTFVESGTGPLDEIPREWTAPAVVRGPVKAEPGSTGNGLRLPGWMLFPSELPDQIERTVAPGGFRAVSSAPAGAAAFGPDEPHFYAAAEAESPLVGAFDSLVRSGTRVEIPPRTHVHALWDLGDYFCAYPVLETEGGAGSRVRFGMHESLKARDGLKHLRDEFFGKALQGFGDEYRPAGARGRFTPLWWRAGRWAEVEIETADSPLALSRLALVETRYPLERESAFSCDDPSLEAVQRVCLRGMQMCSHETLFDCPFYEQQMYPGDTRVQLLVLSALSHDDRMIRRAAEIFAKAMRDDGNVPFNYPTHGTQEGSTYTLCWLLMLRDFLYWHDDSKWLRAQLPAMRHCLSGLSLYEDSDGILRDLPGWNFLDWVVENPWKTGSWAPGSTEGAAARGSIPTLFWMLALQGAAEVEEALGERDMAVCWRRKAARAAKSVLRVFWDRSRGALADTDAFDSFSEHAQSLALVAGILPPAKRKRVAKTLLEAPDLARATVYFSHYLFQAYFLLGRGDLFLKRLDLWRHYVDLGLRTPLEAPEGGKNGQKEARSDCHAWGSHPIYWLQSGTAGVMPASPFFKTVRVAPQPGDLQRLSARVPHPAGFIDVDLSFTPGPAGTVTLPPGVTGTFEFSGRTLPLSPGSNPIA